MCYLVYDEWFLNYFLAVGKEYKILKYLRNLFTPFFPCLIQIRSDADVQNALDTCENKYGKLDAVVSCAGLAASVVMYNDKKQRVINPVIFKNILEVGKISFIHWERI